MASNPDAPSLAVENVSVTYPNGHRAIENVSFTLAGSTVCALVGVNGSGKSTLFNTIMGIVRPQTGTVQVNGLPVAQAMRQNGIAYVPQSENIDWHFPILVKDVVMLGRYGHMGFLRRTRPQDRAAVAAALDRLGIADLAGRQIGALSGGQKKRVFLARALAQESRIILLDEPFAGVDPIAVIDIQKIIEFLKSRGIGVLITDHNVRETLKSCDRAYILSEGRVIAEGSPEEIVANEEARRVYLGEDFTLN